MKDHVQILVCGDEQVGKSSFIGTLISRHFPREVPPVMTDVHLPPEETDENVPCTITDCSALPRDRQQLIEKMESADSIVLLYDVTRPETLMRLDTFWLPLMERNAQEVPVVIVRNKVDTLEGGCREQASEDLRRQMAPLEERYKFFHVSLECSSVIELGVSQVFRHALSAALYPVSPLYDATAERFRPGFKRAVRRLFRVYDIDRDGILSDNELNAFQYDAYQLYLSEEDIVALKRILEKFTLPGIGPRLVQEAREGVEGGVTVEGFLRLMQIFIDKKQMQAPWKALYSNHYDDKLKLTVPLEVSNPPPGKGSASGSNEEVLYLSQSAELFLRRLFHQHAREHDAYPSRVMTEEAQTEVFSVIPDPACAPWDYLRSTEEFDSEESELFGRLRRAPGVCQAMSEEGWIAHWQMVSMNSPSLARAHLFFVGFKGHGEDMLVSRRQLEAQQGVGRRQRGDRLPLQVFVLGNRGSGKSRVLKALRLGDDLLYQGRPETEQRRTEEAQGMGEKSSREDESVVAHGGAGGEGESGNGEDDWEMVADAEVPETCAAYAFVDAGEGSGDRESEELASCRYLSVAVTEVPETYIDAFIDEQVWRCDLALLVIDPSSRDSVDFVMALMADIPPEVPRLVVLCESSRGVNPDVASSARAMCQELELSSVVMANPETGEGFEGGGDLRQRITDPSRPGMLPYATRQRKAKDLNRKLRTAAIVAALGLAVATGFYLATASTEEPAFPGRANGGGSSVGWEAGVGGALRAPVRAAKRAAAVAVEYWRRWRGSVKMVGVSSGYGSTASMASMF